MRIGDIKKPIIVSANDKKIATMIECSMICLACSFLPSPSAFPMSAVNAWLIPPAIAIMRKNIEKVSESAANATVETEPAKYVSVTLNIV